VKICYLGAGTWGFCLACILASNGHEVTLWARSKDLEEKLKTTRKHPKLGDFEAPANLKITSDLKEALAGAEAVVESVTSSGIREVFDKVVTLWDRPCPVIITSKGIEQKTGLLFPEVIREKVDDKLIGCLSGPSHAEEVIANLPTSVVCSAYDPKVMMIIQDIFTTPTFRIYPNADLMGVCFGGAMKNIMAIACGISDGLGFGDNTKAALMTRGLHEIRKLSVTKGCKTTTLNGLSGMGDLCVTCLSKLSRNYRFGRLIAEGLTPDEAKQKIAMAVEGTYTCVSALELGRYHHIAVPITEATYSIIYENLNPKDAVKNLLQRAIKEEHL
jgi:glycerol-3-phosphate dehydrogenase (NAD(P)+)